MIRYFVLITQPGIINHWQSAYPITMEHTAMSLDIILTPRKIPHKISPIHMPYLILKKECQIIAKRRPDSFFCLPSIILDIHFLSIQVDPFFIFVYMLRIAAIHSWEKSRKAIIVLHFHFVINNFIAPVLFHINGFGLFVFHHGSIKSLPVYQRTVSILFPV